MNCLGKGLQGAAGYSSIHGQLCQRWVGCTEHVRRKRLVSSLSSSSSSYINSDRGKSSAQIIAGAVRRDPPNGRGRSRVSGSRLKRRNSGIKQDADLQEVLDLASEDELHEIYDSLHGTLLLLLLFLPLNTQSQRKEE